MVKEVSSNLDMKSQKKHTRLTFLDDWKQHADCQYPRSLLWDYNMDNPDWEKLSTIAVLRVLELGRKEDYYALYNIYGGPEKVAEIVKKIPSMNPKEANWASLLFGIDKEEMLCYKRKQSIKAL